MTSTYIFSSFLFLNLQVYWFCLSFTRPLNIAMMDAAPFVCRENISPCPPFLPTGPNPENGCLYGGLMTKNQGCIHGYLVDLIGLISSPSKANFSADLWHIIGSNFGGYNNVVQEVFQPGFISRKTGRNLTMCGGDPCDMAMGDITQNWARSSLSNALFSVPYMTVGLQIVARMQHTSTWNTSKVFLLPFQKELWFSIFFTMVYLSGMLFLIERGKLFFKFFSLLKTDGWKKAFIRVFFSNEFEFLQEGKEESTAITQHKLDIESEGVFPKQKCEEAPHIVKTKRKQVRMDFIDTLWFTFLSVMYLQDASSVVTKASRAVMWTWMTVVVILVAAYTASLTSALSSQSVVLSMHGLSTGPFAADTMATAAAECKGCLVLQKSSNTGTYMTSAKHVDVNDVRDESQVAPGLSGNAKYKKILIDPTVKAWVGDAITVQGATSTLADSGLKAEICEWSVVGVSFDVQSFAFPINYSMDVSTRNAFNQVLTDLNSNLLLNGLQSKWFLSYPSCMNPSLQNSSNSFNLQNFMGPLLIVWTVSAFALLWKITRGFYLAHIETHTSKTAGND